MNLDVCRNCDEESCLMVMFDQKRDDGSKIAVMFHLCNFSSLANEILANRNGKRLTKYIIEKEDDSFKCIYCKGSHFSFDEDLFELFLPDNDDWTCPLRHEHLLSFLNRETK